LPICCPWRYSSVSVTVCVYVSVCVPVYVCVSVYPCLNPDRGALAVRTRWSGTHMAIGMALGLVVLAGGRASVSRSNSAIAALVASLYPRFPLSASDNTYHPQPLRHLYALAVDFRGVEVRDVETGAVVHAPVEVTVAQSLADPALGTVRLVTPSVLPEVRLTVFASGGR
jgi:hypothetical protein